MNQDTLIELVATFNQNHPSFGASSVERGVSKGVAMVEALSGELSALGVSQETIDKALTNAMQPRHMGEMLANETRQKLGLRPR